MTFLSRFLVGPAVLLMLTSFPALAQTGTITASAKSQSSQQSTECPKCHHVNRPNAKFCSECGTVLRKGGCVKCGATLVPGEKFCTDCGFAVPAAGAAQGETPKEPTPSGEPTTQPEVSYPTFKLGGFHDIVYNGDSRSSPRGFSLGQFVLHTNSMLAPSVQFFSELSFSPRTDAGTGTPAAP